MGEEGREIAGRYRLLSKLGQGGMGCVWRATHLTLGSEVAIKLIDEEYAEDAEVRARFVREARAAAQLRSPHVVQILDFGVDDKTPYIAMELMQGESLADRIRREGPLSPLATAQIIAGISRALFRAHEAGIIHRDLKPDNVFIVHNDDDEIAKVLDFGIARHDYLKLDNAHRTDTGAVLGSPYYMSPEQAEGERHLDHRTDVWAMGVIAYECLLGTRPFAAETLGGLFLAICTKAKPVPSEAGPVPEGFDAWFDKCTARDVDERFLTVKEASRELRKLLDPKFQEGGLDSINSPRTSDFETSGASSSTAGEKLSMASSTPGLGVTSLSQKGTERSLRFIALAALGLGLGLGLLLLQLNPNNAPEAEELKRAATAPSSPAEAMPSPPSEETKQSETEPHPSAKAVATKPAGAPKKQLVSSALKASVKPAAQSPETSAVPRKPTSPKASPRPSAQPTAAQPAVEPAPVPQPAPASKRRVNLGI